MNPSAFNFLERFTLPEGQVLLTGLQALVRIPMDQFRRDQAVDIRLGTYVSGYQGSPLGTVEQQFRFASQLLKQHQIHFQAGLNEEIAATAISGTQLLNQFPHSQFDGVLGMWFGKGPGVDRTGDAFRHGVMMGTSPYGAVLAFAGDDPSCKSSTIPSDTTISLYDVNMPTLYPGNQQEMVELGLHGIGLSRYSGLWTGMKIVTDVADSGSVIDVYPEQALPKLPELIIDGKPFSKKQQFLLVGKYSLEIERHLIYERLEAAKAYVYENQLDRIVVRSSQDTVGIVAFGKTYYDLRQALQELGLNDDKLQQLGIRLYKLAMIAPVEPKRLREFAEGLETLLVVEEKRGFTETLIRDALFNHPNHPKVFGKLDSSSKPLFQANGELLVNNLVLGLTTFFSECFPQLNLSQQAAPIAAIQKRQYQPTMPRVPYFCSGCPHNTSTRNPEGEVGGAGIGCHTMSMYMNRGVDFVTQMGGEGANWMGLSQFTDKPHLIQNIGDGTYFHSASKAVEACVSGGVNITFKILYNSVVAMTGGQQAQGGIPPKALAQKLVLEGAQKVVIVTESPAAYPQMQIGSKIKIVPTQQYDQTLESLRSIKGVTVLIYEQECAAEKRRKRKRGKVAAPKKHIFINPAVCEGCGDCGVQSNCLSVVPMETEYGRKTQIHQSSCNFDYSCLKGDCPAFMSIDLGEGAEKIAPISQIPPIEFESLVPPQTSIDLKTPYRVLLTGIGGTGVLTVSVILATAAFQEGRYVSHIDQTGLAQKGGAVTSHLTFCDSKVDGSFRIPPGQAHAVLGFDSLVATAPENLNLMSPSQTTVIANTHGTHTATTVTNVKANLPSVSHIEEQLNRVTQATRNVFFDSNALTQALFGDEQANNIFLLGVALQKGQIPLAPESIEFAIRANGVSVVQNIAALRWGRRYGNDPKALKPYLTGNNDKKESKALALEKLKQWEPQNELTFQKLTNHFPAHADLQELLYPRVSDLILYQNEPYAKQFLEFIGKTYHQEKAIADNQDNFEVTKAVIKNLFKLMAYKDEYEVARLWQQDPSLSQAKQAFSGKKEASIYLQPPFLRRMGLDRKLKISENHLPWLNRLAKLKFLRNTPFDVFGYSTHRKAEHQLIDWYRQLVETVLAYLTPQNRNQAIALVSIPDQIRGYEELKEKNITEAKELAQKQLHAYKNLVESS